MKFSNLKTKLAALVLAFALCLSGLVAAPNKAVAATDDAPLLYQSGDAAAKTPVNYTFNIPKSTYTYLDVFVPQPTGLTFTVTSAGNEEIFTESVLGTDPNVWTYSNSLGAYAYSLDWPSPTPGDYTVSLTFGTDTKYVILIDQDVASIKMSSNSLVLTKGFSDKLSVSDATGTVKWSSSKTSVATVNSSGKVTAKKTGTATITAKDANGASAQCVVTVKANTYSRSKLTTQDVSYGNADFSVHKMSYNSKGDLVIQANFLNNSGKKVVQLKNVKFTIKSVSGKTIGTYSVSSKKVSVLHGGSKTFKYTIKKNKLKIKTTQDIRNASVTRKGQYITQSY